MKCAVWTARPRHFRTWLFSLVLAALLGVATTVTVAWSFATIAPLRGLPPSDQWNGVRIPEYEQLGWQFALMGTSRTGFAMNRQLMAAEFRPHEHPWMYASGLAADSWHLRGLIQLLDLMLERRTPEQVRTSERAAESSTDSPTQTRFPDDEAKPPLWPKVTSQSGRLGLIITDGQLAVGWPLLCLRARFAQSLSPSQTQHVWSAPGGFIIHHTSPPFVNLIAGRGFPVIWPYRPYWPGLLANTLFFTVLWTIPLVFVPALRRRQRRRHHRCVSCAYDLSGTSTDRPCPECGLLREDA